jgi:hypothetical protein
VWVLLSVLMDRVAVKECDNIAQLCDDLSH